MKTIYFAGVVLLGLAALAAPTRAVQILDPNPSFPPPPPEAPYEELTNDLVEFTNFFPEPFAGIAFDEDEGVLAVNPLNNTWLRFGPPPGLELSLRVLTGHNPVSIAYWNPGTETEDGRVIVVCTGSHAAFLHAADDGRILDVLQLDSEPADLVIDHENDLAYVSCRGDDTVQEIDLATFSVTQTFPIPCGQRPGPLYLDRGLPEVADDTHVYVASMVTGNNSIPINPEESGAIVGFIENLDTDAFDDDLPDDDVFRIHPATSSVVSVVRNAGSLIFEVARNPATGDLWILSTESNNKNAALNTEPKLKGITVINQIKAVPDGVIVAPAGIDLDDLQPGMVGGQYDSARSLNQARAMAFMPDGQAFVASPLSDVLVELGVNRRRAFEYALPERAQCYALGVHPTEIEGTSLAFALCLGSMTVEVFQEGVAVAIQHLPLGNDPTPEHVREGRDIMLDGQISKDGRSSCLACHEGGRTDMLGWSIADEPNDVKDVMVTQSLLSIADTFPHHWRGERDLPDFQKAFVGLNGAPEALAPDAEEMDDFIAFVHSLKAPANPIQDYRRIVNDELSDADDESEGSAIVGQQSFLTLRNFNNNTCAECHAPTTGSNGNMLAEELDALAPRAQNVEVAHLRQLQHRSVDSIPLDLGFAEPLRVNENGFGATHSGRFPTVLEFINNDEVFPDLEPEDRVDIFKFVQQFDQGIAPGAHWSTWFDSSPPAGVISLIVDILITGAEAGWLDVVAFGTFDLGSGPEDVRWLYRPRTNLFESGNPLVPNRTWIQLRNATLAGVTRNAFMGVPLGNGWRIAFDPDADDLADKDEIAALTDSWNPDSDEDGWPDGYEVANGSDPNDDQDGPVDTEVPELDESELQLASARLAKYFVRFSEDVRYTVSYALTGGPLLTFEQRDFVRADTCVLTHSAPSRPIFGQENFPEPDGTTVFSAWITMTDRAGNVTGPVALSDTFTPLAVQQQDALVFAHVAGMTATVVSTAPLEILVEIEPRLNRGAPNYDLATGRVVFCTLTVQDPTNGEWVQAAVPEFSSDPAPSTIVLPSTPPFLGGTYMGTPGDLIVCPQNVPGTAAFTFWPGPSMIGKKVKVVVQGILRPLATPGEFDLVSQFEFQQLLTEEFSTLEIQL